MVSTDVKTTEVKVSGHLSLQSDNGGKVTAVLDFNLPSKVKIDGNTPIKLEWKDAAGNENKIILELQSGASAQAQDAEAIKEIKEYLESKQGRIVKVAHAFGTRLDSDREFRKVFISIWKQEISDAPNWAALNKVVAHGMDPHQFTSSSTKVIAADPSYRDLRLVLANKCEELGSPGYTDKDNFEYIMAVVDRDHGVVASPAQPAKDLAEERQVKGTLKQRVKDFAKAQEEERHAMKTLEQFVKDLRAS